MDLCRRGRQVAVVGGQFVQQRFAQTVEVVAGALARVRQVDTVDALDTSRPWLQHHHTVSQEQCFLDIVGHQQRGDPRAFADR
ncbi:hypothetical protein D3C79_806520 [compost metagenome]